MDFTLYYNSSEKNKVGKSLNNSVEMTGRLRNQSGVINPSIIIRNSNPSRMNYAYIPEFKRYYFITNITSLRNNIWQIDLHCDVLESFKDYFLGINCIIDKQEYLEKANTLLPDGTYKTTVETFNEVVTFPNNVFLESPSYVLTCV